MTLKTYTLNWFCAVLAAAVLAGCASGGGRAPVSEHGAAEKKPAESPATPPAAKKIMPREKDWRPQTYVVQKGDTLYGIAFNHGMDYHEIADLNGIKNPDMIKTGQEIRLFPDSTDETTSHSTRLAKDASLVAGYTAVIKPAVEIKHAVESKPQEALIQSQPKVAKLPYSEKAVAEIEKMQQVSQKSEPVAVVKMEPKPEPKPELKPDVATNNASENDEDVEWSMPTSGKVVGEFSESSNQKGIDVAGKRGQPVVASAAGKVVYSGSGLRGYGKLVIIKHNKTYLSAYAHNDQILVKEGQNVTKGQKIAEMGNSDTDQVKLHFEIRKFGKPVDPTKYLPLVKS